MLFTDAFTASVEFIVVSQPFSLILDVVKVLEGDSTSSTFDKYLEASLMSVEASNCEVFFINSSFNS